MKINTESWEEFLITDFFEVQTSISNLTSSDLIDYGEFPVYSSSSENGGLFGFSDIKPKLKVSTETPFYIIFGDHTKNFNFVENDFNVMDNVKILKPKIFNKKVILFIFSVWGKMIPDLGYSRHWSSASKVKLLLPSSEGNKPDLHFMEQYIEKILDEFRIGIDKLIRVNNKYNKIDVSEWKEYVIGEVFSVERPNSRSVMNYEFGKTPFVSSGNYNNGVDSYRQPNAGEALDKGNCISISPVDGSTFYQPSDFLGRGGGGSSIILLYNENLNKYNGLFMSTVIKEKMEYLYYGDMGSSSSINDEKIVLPTTYDGVIDWGYMESYIKLLIPDIKSNIKVLRKIGNSK